MDIFNGGRIPVPGKLQSSLKNTGLTSGQGEWFSFSKLFFILIIICTIAYISLQIQKSKYDKKYMVALLVLLVFALVGGVFILKIPNVLHPVGRVVVYILKFLFIGGPLITFLILEILMGSDKF
jgi:cytochrome bd-type quinol oxidase subunit 2